MDDQANKGVNLVQGELMEKGGKTTMSHIVISHNPRISRCLRVIKEDNMTSRLHKFGLHFMVQKLFGDCSRRMMDHSSNRWLNMRINAKNMDRLDVIIKELRQVRSEGFDIFMIEEEHLSSTVCVYGPDKEALNS